MSTVIEDKIPLVQVEAAADQTDVEYDFWIREATDLIVLLDGEPVDESDYDVTGVQNTLGGKVIFSTPLTGGEIVTVASQLPFSRLTGFVTSGSLRADALNIELTYFVACLLQLRRDVDRKFGIPLSSTLDPNGLDLPAPVDGKALVWDGTSGKLKNSQLNPDDAFDLSGAVERAEDAADRAEAVASNTQPQAIITGTSKTVSLANDPGKQFVFTNAAAINVNLPVPAVGDIGKFVCFLQLGPGRINFQAVNGSGNAVLNSQNLFKTRAIYAKAAVEVSYIDGAGTIGWILTGDLAA